MRCALAVFIGAGALTGSAHALGTLSPFTQEAAPRGLVYSIQNYPQTDGYLGFGCGFADFNGDGWPDVVILGNALDRVGLFQNDGDGTFTDRSTTSGIPDLPQASAFAAGDYDGDGDVDLFLTQCDMVFPHTTANVLMRNDGNFVFTNVTTTAGVGTIGSGKGACWGDYDGDGRLDLYLCNYTGIAPGGPNKLWHNNGNGTFTDVAVAQTVTSGGYSFQAVWFDYDKDGDVDLYLSNDRGHLSLIPNQLWRNDAGTLVNVSAGSGANLAFYSMGIACGDFDLNGWPDLYCTNIEGTYSWGSNNPLFLNQGDGTFVEFGAAAGVDNPWGTSWGSIFFDFDNDGHLDLYVNNQFDPNRLYKGPSVCTEVAAAVGATGIHGGLKASFGSAVADVDRDGDLDLLLNDLGSNVQLLINHEGETRHWVRFVVVGLAPNHFAIGARVELTLDGVTQVREVLAGGNTYLGQNELTAHFGAGEDAAGADAGGAGEDAAGADAGGAGDGAGVGPGIADQVFVSWPGGATTRTLTNVPLDEEWTLYPPSRLGDADGDGDQLLDDFFAFADCHEVLLAPGCEMMDFDGDSHVDDDDAAAFFAAYDGDLDDCNENSTIDLAEILENPALDANEDGILDACLCPADLDTSGNVGFGDLTVLLLNWGPCPPAPCPWDLDTSGNVGFGDLTVLLLGWGPC